MDDTVAGALISAAASIIVAAISKSRPDPPKEHHQEAPHPPVPVRPWLLASVILGGWLLASPALINRNFVEIDFFLIPLVALALGFARPINPWMAASMTMAFFAINWIAGAMSNHAAHVTTYPDHTHLQIVLAFALGSAVATFLASYWRSKARATAQQPYIPSTTDRYGNVAADLERVSRLRAQGVLTPEQFEEAKSVILRSAHPMRREDTGFAL